jgi:aspartate racemase
VTVSRHIGIVGCSAEGAALCYRTLCAEPAHPEVSMHTHPLADYLACLDRGDWTGVGALMLSSARKLAAAGADFLICPDNTIHPALPGIEPRLPLPWLHIAEVVAAEARRRGFRRLGLTGTRFLVENEMYPQKLGDLGCVRPDAADREALHRLILDDLVRGVFRPEGTALLDAVIGRLADAGCDAVILGCTELPLVVSPAPPLPVLDSTRLLARAALLRPAPP